MIQWPASVFVWQCIQQTAGQKPGSQLHQFPSAVRKTKRIQDAIVSS
jgi:hypothetical protein